MELCSGETEVSAERLQAAAELRTLRRDAIRMIDGTGPTIEVREPGPEPESASAAEPGVEPERVTPKRERRKKRSEEPAQAGETHILAPSPDESRASEVLSDLSSPTKKRRVGKPKQDTKDPEAPSDLA